MVVGPPASLMVVGYPASLMVVGHPASLWLLVTLQVSWLLTTLQASWLLFPSANPMIVIDPFASTMMVGLAYKSLLVKSITMLDDCFCSEIYSNRFLSQKSLLSGWSVLNEICKSCPVSLPTFENFVIFKYIRVNFIINRSCLTTFAKSSCWSVPKITLIFSSITYLRLLVLSLRLLVTQSAWRRRKFPQKIDAG